MLLDMTLHGSAGRWWYTEYGVVGGQYGGPFCGAGVGNMDPAAEVAALKQLTGAWWW
jgi:hypothetical protein